MFTIGGFARAGGVSARMLRHYEMIGLLAPAGVRENGYRYYDAAQLPVLAQIETLKRYGFSLREIASLLPLPADELARRIHTRWLRLYGELHELRATIRRMEDELSQMEGTDLTSEKYHVIVMKIPEQRVFGLRRTISVGEVHELFAELRREIAARGLRQIGPTQQMYLGTEFNYDAMDVEAQAEVEGEGEGVKRLPAQECAAVTHVGPYETIKYAYDAITAWFAANPEWESCGPSIERYLRDEGMAADPEELETGLLFPIRRKES